MKLTREQINAGKTAKGGFTKKQIKAWGVAWPPKKGWRKELEISLAPWGRRPFQSTPKEERPEYIEMLSMRKLYEEKSSNF